MLQKRRKFRRIVIGILIAAACLLAGAVTVADRTSPYVPDETALQALLSDENVTVMPFERHGGKTPEGKELPWLGYFYDGAGTDRVLIFYPGALVDLRAYAPLLRGIAESGTDVIEIRTPAKMAILNVAQADMILHHMGTILEGTDNEYSQYYVGGHSMGAAVAGIYVSSHLDFYDGLIMLAGFPTRDLHHIGFSMLSVYGTNDMDVEGLQRNDFLRPDDYTEVVIEGGNHAWFGNYGVQKGDGTATISHEEQQAQTLEAITAYMDAHAK